MFSQGSIFRLAKDGTGFVVLHHFDGESGDGESPIGTVIEGNDGCLYGTTSSGGSSTGVWGGVVYRIKKDGSGYCILHNFGGPLTEPGYITTALFQASDGAFYGTAKFGVDNKGAVFRITPLVPPTLSIVTVAGQTALSWAPATPGFVLQQNNSLDPLTWTNAPSGSTNPITLSPASGSQFFRLIK